MSIAWSTVQAALASWVRTGSGLAESACLWAEQEAPRPSGTWISISTPTVRRVGQDWLDVLNNPTPSAGAEILHRARGVREVSITLTCYSTTAIGASGAAQILDAVIAKAKLPTQRDALGAAGVSIARVGQVTPIPGLRNSSLLEPRATVEVVGYLVSEVEETGTYIETAELVNLIEVEDSDDFEYGLGFGLQSFGEGSFGL